MVNLPPGDYRKQCSDSPPSSHWEYILAKSEWDHTCLESTSECIKSKISRSRAAQVEYKFGQLRLRGIFSKINRHARMEGCFSIWPKRASETSECGSQNAERWNILFKTGVNLSWVLLCRKRGVMSAGELSSYWPRPAAAHLSQIWGGSRLFWFNIIRHVGSDLSHSDYTVCRWCINALWDCYKKHKIQGVFWQLW